MKREYEQDKIYENLRAQTKLEIYFMKNELKKCQELFLLHQELEPSKLFKKRYFEWVLKKKQLEEDICFFKKEIEELSHEYEKY